MKHLIFTGKNGSGKTSIVEAMAEYLSNVLSDQYFISRENWLKNKQNELQQAIQNKCDEGEIVKLQQEVEQEERKIQQSRRGLDIQFNEAQENIYGLNLKYHFILAYYKADRVFEAAQPRHVEKVQLKDNYGLTEFPRDEFVKYLLDLKMTEALARNNKKDKKADQIHAWFEALEQLLKKIFSDDTLKLIFDEDSFEFHISQQGKELFDFNTLSSGYQAVLDIVVDIIMRMQNRVNRSFDFNIPGIVLIDEIETHLHLELQKNIMPLLTTIFPNIQFVVTTHSPFVLNSIKDVVIYDLEKNKLVEDGLNNVPYDGIVEGFFGADKMSNELKEKFEQFKHLVEKRSLSDDDLDKIAELEVYLDEIPDYLAFGLTTEYQRLKLEFMNRGDLNG
ncbi:MAG: AAA family ATPase [Lachnospiraceae bacterium]|nr:AAA family ATPase [Lachnospiraceae bacterium]